MSGGALLRRRAGPRTPTRLAWLPELATLLSLYLIYRQIRGMAPARAGVAQHNAALLVRATPPPVRALEESLGDLTAAQHWLAMACTVYYNGLHVPATACVLVWLWRTRPGDYPTARSAMVILTVVGLATFWLFPVAPPRLARDEPDGIASAVEQAVGDMHSAHLVHFVNDFAAFPSLHMAWACWCAWAVSRFHRGRSWTCAWLYPTVTGGVLIATRNHYSIDLLGGVVAFQLAVWSTRWAGTASGSGNEP